MGLRLSPEKTLITHIDEGLDFLGWRIQRHRKRGTNRYYVYTYPAKKAAAGRHGQGQDVVPADDTNQPLDVLLLRLNRMLRGWCAYFRPGVSSATFGYLGPTRGSGSVMAAPQTPPDHLEGTPPPLLRRRMVASHRDGQLFNPAKVQHHALPLPGNSHPHARGRSRDEEHRQPDRDLWRARCPETGTPGSGGGPGKRTGGNTGTAPRADLTVDQLAATEY